MRVISMLNLKCSRLVSFFVKMLPCLEVSEQDLKSNKWLRFLASMLPFLNIELEMGPKVKIYKDGHFDGDGDPNELTAIKEFIWK